MEKSSTIDKTIPRVRATKKLLRVVFPNGKTICYKSATVTFVEALRTIGIEKLQNINIEVSHLPLISQKLYPQLEGYQKPIVHGWYVTVMSDTEIKYRQLLSIKQQLELDITIEMGDDLEADKTKLFQRSRKAKENLLIKFPDGVFIGEDSPKKTYIETIKKIGIEALIKRRIELLGKPLFTKTEQYRGQVEIGENLWLVIPELTKEKVKSLKVIEAYMGIKLEITII